MDIVRQLKKAGAKLLLSVEEMEDKDAVKSRLDVCRDCEELQTKTMQCGVCGCFMDIKTGLKTNRDPDLNGQVVYTHCPLGKWGDKDLANYYRKKKGQQPI